VATRVLSDAEAEALATWAPEVSRSDLAAYFTLTVDDLRWVRSFRSPRTAADRLGLAVQLGALRFLGFVPADLTATPTEVVTHMAKQIGVSPVAFGRYGREVSGRSRREHLEAAVAQAGLAALRAGRVEGARRLAGDPGPRARHPLGGVSPSPRTLRAEHVVRPGLDRLTRAVAGARSPLARRSTGDSPRSSPPSVVPSSTLW